MIFFYSQPNTDFSQSNSVCRELFDKHHGSFKNHRLSTRSSYELSTSLTSPTPSSNTIANISRDNNNNYEDIFPTVSLIPSPIPTFTNNDSINCRFPKGKDSFYLKKLINSSPATTKFEISQPTNNYYELHKQVSPCSTFNIQHNASFKNNDIGISFLSILSRPVVSKNIVFFSLESHDVESKVN